MEFLTALKSFKKWAINAIPKAISKNKELREEIRGIVGDLSDDLMNGLNLVAMRLRASKRIADENEFFKYLSGSEQELFKSFSEFRVCADIRNLEDRFNRFFDPTRTAVTINHTGEVKSLISTLENHERLIFDMVHSPWREIEVAVGNKESREHIHELINSAVSECESKSNEVKNLARDIIDKV